VNDPHGEAPREAYRTHHHLPVRLCGQDRMSAPMLAIRRSSSTHRGDGAKGDAGSDGAGSDAGAAEDASDAAPCTPWPDGGVTFACGTGPATAPAQYCLQTGSDPSEAWTAPSRCGACQENYTCACLEQSNPYCASNEIAGCFPDDGGLTLVCE
jgi:hypothetical protein